MNGLNSSRVGKDSKVDREGRHSREPLQLASRPGTADASSSSRTLRSATASTLSSERTHRKRPLSHYYEGEKGFEHGMSKEEPLPKRRYGLELISRPVLCTWKDIPKAHINGDIVPDIPNPFISRRPLFGPTQIRTSSQSYKIPKRGDRRVTGSSSRHSRPQSTSKANPVSATREGCRPGIEIEKELLRDNPQSSERSSRETIAPVPAPGDVTMDVEASSRAISDKETNFLALHPKPMKPTPLPSEKTPEDPPRTVAQVPTAPLPRQLDIPGPIATLPTPYSSMTMTCSPNAAGPSTVSTNPSTSQLLSAHNTPSATAAPNVPIPAYRQHERHWNRDGNLIVVIGGVGYKLHQSRVAKLSKWFSALIAESSDDAAGSGIVTYEGKGKERMVESDEQIRRRAGVSVDWEKSAEDGADVVLRVELDEMKWVEEQDWEMLVDALDDAITYFQNPPPLTCLYAVLRAARALSFPAFESWAKTIVQGAWSDDLKQLGEPLPQGADPVGAMTVGRRCGMPGVLKRAIGMPTIAREADGDERGGRSNAVLPTKVILLLTSARAKLQSIWVRETAQFPDALLQPPNCGGPCTSMDANAAHTAHRELVIRSGVQERYMNDVIGGFVELAEGKWAQKGFCPTCVGTLRAGWRASRDRVWGECDELFGLVR
ncbi:hypothetical protein DFP72DRAFT_911379 [Ephemerocybe angulata]|uniref:BTB domain-containing protein n=1 Tax=Ephemerocybe angulata TaxID=980116 RepID=A0A8H6HPB7_9AGAR|nr:hypothetical protein DFP72DRAFT_911379 [Tulosesus angulatus]